MKRFSSCCFITFIVASIFTGCTNTSISKTDPNIGTNTNVKDNESKTDNKIENKVDLLLWLPPFGNGDTLDLEFWNTQLKPWAVENNVNLSIEITPWAGYEEKYLTGFSSGQGPDVGYMYNEMFNDFIEMGAIEDFDKFFTQEEKDNYIYWDKGNIKGGQYALPFVVGNARILYFNMDILNEAGVTELPKTWDDLIVVASKIKDANIEDVIPFSQEWADPAIGALNTMFYPYLWQAGGDIFNEDGTEVALMYNDAAVSAAQFLHDLRFKYNLLSEESMAMTGPAQKELFKEGKIAIACMDANAANDLTEANINWDFVSSLEKDQKAIWVASDSLIMNSKSKNKELAADLMKYMTSKEVMEAFHNDIAKFPPITKDAQYLDNERFKNMYENESEYFHTLPVAKGSFKVMDTLYKNLQLMMLGDLTPEEAIRETVEYSMNILK